MTPRDSTGVISDNDFQRTGVIYPSTVSNSLWALSTEVGTSDSKLGTFYLIWSFLALFLDIINYLVTIAELMEKGLVHFRYWKLCFSIGGDVDDRNPNKVYKSLRVSWTYLISKHFLSRNWGDMVHWLVAPARQFVIRVRILDNSNFFPYRKLNEDYIAGTTDEYIKIPFVFRVENFSKINFEIKFRSQMSINFSN